jgi:predicted protein tyrosine phosphatase
MEKKNLLFICTANFQRSPTAAALFKDNEKYIGKSCGIHQQAVRPISKQAIEWADVIFCMEDIHKDFIDDNYSDEIGNRKIIVLNIEDNYERGDEGLIAILKEKLKELGYL